MKRYFLLLACVVSAAAWLILRTERPPVRVVGVIQFTANNLSTLEGFKDGMADLGWVEGVSVRYVFPGVAGDAQTLDAHLDEVLAAKPDLLFVSPTPAALAAQRATGPSGIPVVFAPVNDPVSAGVVENLAKPEANLTGVRLSPSEGRRLQSLLALRPGARRVFVPYNPLDASAQASLDQLRQSSETLGVEIAAVAMETNASSESLAAMIPANADALFLPRDGLAMSRYMAFSDAARRLGIPMSTPRLDQVEAGVLTGYGFVGREIGKQAAAMAHLLLGGTPVSHVPVETAQDFMFLNLKTARSMGLDVPDSIVRQAHYVFRPES